MSFGVATADSGPTAVVAVMDGDVVEIVSLRRCRRTRRIVDNHGRLNGLGRAAGDGEGSYGRVDHLGQHRPSPSG